MTDSNPGGPGGGLDRGRAAALLRVAVEAWRRDHPAATMPVEGRSMVPTLPAGTEVRIDSLGDRAPGRGDILLYFMNEQLVVHRVIRRLEPDRYLTKGDGRATFDVDPLPRDAIVGRVVEARRRGRRICLEGRGPAVYAGVVATLSAVTGTLARLARAIDRAPRKLLGRDVRPALTLLSWVDRVVMATVHLAGFRLAHRSRAAAADPAAGNGPSDGVGRGETVE